MPMETKRGAPRGHWEKSVKSRFRIFADWCCASAFCNMRRMTEEDANRFLLAVFTDGERKLLFAHSRFKEAMALSTETQLPQLNKLALQIIMEGRHVPPRDGRHSAVRPSP